jgi:hypothetical protein
MISKQYLLEAIYLKQIINGNKNRRHLSNCVGCANKIACLEKLIVLLLTRHLMTVSGKLILELTIGMIEYWDNMELAGLNIGMNEYRID